MKIFLFGAMRDNGDDAFGEPLSRVDRPAHVSSTSTSSVPTTLMTNPMWPWLKKFQEPNIDFLHLQ